jgi:hypothetical protein
MEKIKIYALLKAAVKRKPLTTPFIGSGKALFLGIRYTSRGSLKM